MWGYIFTFIGGMAIGSGVWWCWFLISAVKANKKEDLTSNLTSFGNAAAPAPPTGLCIASSQGQVCAISTSNKVAPKGVEPQNFHPGYYVTADYRSAASVVGDIMDNPDIVGVKKIYKWVNIEPAEGVYDFSQIESDLAIVAVAGKHLWISIQDTAWNSNNYPQTPKYMWKDPKYGCDSRYYGTYERTVQSGGWLACIWNENFLARRAALYQALGKRFNNELYFEGINIDETSTGQAPSEYGWSVDNQRYGFMTNALALKKAFPNKPVMQMINFAPYDLADFSAGLVQNGIGLSGPDVTTKDGPHPTYDLEFQYHYDAPIGIEVQGSNYTRINQNTGQYNTASDLLQAAKDQINPWYMFWMDRDPYYGNDILPTLETSGPLPAAQEFYNSLQTP